MSKEMVCEIFKEVPNAAVIMYSWYITVETNASFGLLVGFDKIPYSHT